MTFEFFLKLSQNFSQLLDDIYDYDIIINVGEKSNTREFHAHSNVLKARSPYFKRAFSQNWVIKENGIYIFTKSDISPIVFEIIIRYMYTGILDLRKHAGSDILDLLVASEELLIEELVAYVQKYFIENQTEWIQNNFVKVLNKTYIFKSCKQLQNHCLEFISECPEPFFDSPEFPTLEKDILLELLERDDLLIDEIKLWNYLIKWGIAQTSELREKNITDLNEWNEEDFLNLKNTLNPFILHIRFFDISKENFYNKIWPFKKVLSEMLFEDIVAFHLGDIKPEKNTIPPRHGRIYDDSVIIKPKHAAIFINWIQKKDVNSRIPMNKYNFNLIYRGSRDGFNINTMRSKCNGQEACILVVKVKGSGIIIGGYNPLGWTYYNVNANNGLNNNVNIMDSFGYVHTGLDESFISRPVSPYPTFHNNNSPPLSSSQIFANNKRNHNNNNSRFSSPFLTPFRSSSPILNNNQNYWSNTTESFIFSLDDGKDSSKFKISRVTNNNCAMYESNYANISLNFGNSDLIINGINGSCNKSNYESNILDTNSFSIEEMEIFRFY